VQPTCAKALCHLNPCLNLKVSLTKCEYKNIHSTAFPLIMRPVLFLSLPPPNYSLVNFKFSKLKQKHNSLNLRGRYLTSTKLVSLSVRIRAFHQCFSTAGPRPSTGPWHQLQRAARGSPGICHFSFLSNFHE